MKRHIILLSFGIAALASVSLWWRMAVHDTSVSLENLSGTWYFQYTDYTYELTIDKEGCSLLSSRADCFIKDGALHLEFETVPGNLGERPPSRKVLPDMTLTIVSTEHLKWEKNGVFIADLSRTRPAQRKAFSFIGEWNLDPAWLKSLDAETKKSSGALFKGAEPFLSVTNSGCTLKSIPIECVMTEQSLVLYADKTIIFFDALKPLESPFMDRDLLVFPFKAQGNNYLILDDLGASDSPLRLERAQDGAKR